ncbi:MAG: hypothetical protein A2033_12860 [Bacteroidetes bacterium GWA2_31_9]|nr:MAG: hypothetical protein A2033_12860 [Bacteroidetes bacterium GWA2_31_9]
MKDTFENINEIVTGFKIQKGQTVGSVFNKTENYVIYEIKETNKITYKTSPKFQDTTYEIAVKLDKVESYLDRDNVLWKKYKNTLADIYFLALENKSKGAEGLLDSILPELENEIDSYSKIYYLIPCIIIIIGMIAISAIVKTFNFYVSINAIDGCFIDGTLAHMIYIATFGGIGGLLSVAININKHQDKIKSRLNWGPRTYAGMFRMLVAMLSGLILYFIIKSKIIIIGFDKDLNNNYNPYILYTLAIIAGFSENLIPDLMKKVEGDGITKH